VKTVGFVINPIAGMGGSVGLKGTDGLSKEAEKLGAKPQAEKRAEAALNGLVGQHIKFLACAGAMGEDVLKKTGFECEVVYAPAGKETSAEDTRKACMLFLEKKVDLILFCGGDGTARDVYSVVGERVPILGIPAGVKMHSAVFAINPKAASDVVALFLQQKPPRLLEAEVMDIDEEAYRGGHLSAKLFGYAKIPYIPEKVQGRKMTFETETDEESKEKIAAFALEFMWDNSLYIIGAGSTTEKILEKAKLKKTLLGVDLVKEWKVVGVDVNEQQILDVLEKEKKAKIIVSPIGAQGFVFGRGSQQISPAVIQKVGIENIIVVATPHKLAQTPHLLVDTGDPGLDKQLSGFRQVVCGYRMAQRKKVFSA
jgi:predicted polyphosphate/ATP-dependent NAD kinase